MPTVRFPLTKANIQKQKSFIWVISSDESFLSQDALTCLIDDNKRQHRQITHQLLSQSAAWEALAQSTAQASLFTKPTCHHLQIKSWQIKTENIQSFLDSAAKNPEDRWILQGPKMTKATQQKKAIALLLAKANHLAIWPMDNKQTLDWLSTRAASLGISLSPEAKVAAMTNTDGCPMALWQMLQQLCLLDRPSPIHAEIIDSLRQEAGELSIFQWHEAIIAGQWQKALKDLPRLQSTCELIPTLSLLQKTMDQMTELLWAKKQGKGQEVLKKLYPWPKQQTLISKGILSMPPKTLMQARQTLFTIERNLKTTYPYDGWQALSQLLYESCQ